MISKGDQTREAILDTGLASASIEGLEGISIGALAQQMSMSKSGLYAHFNSKENLQVALLEAATARFIQFVVAPGLKAPRGEPRVRELVARWLAWDRAEFLPGGCIFITAGVEFDERPGPVRDVLVKSQRDWLDTLAGAARIAIQEGHFRDDLDVRQFASEAYSLAYGYHFISRLDLDPDAETRIQRAMDRLITDASPRTSSWLLPKNPLPVAVARKARTFALFSCERSAPDFAPWRPSPRRRPHGWRCT